MHRNIMAILRDVTPDHVVDVAQILVASGITQIEVPLNSPAACDSIGRLRAAMPNSVSVGAGTVLTPEQVAEVNYAGGDFIVSPNCNLDVIRATKSRGLRSCPGVLTPTECFAALGEGADILKLFPAFKIGIDGLQAYQAVLPNEACCYAVGGVGVDDFSAWRDAGIGGVGMGSNLYRPTFTLDEIKARSESIVSAWDAW